MMIEMKTDEFEKINRQHSADNELRKKGKGTGDEKEGEFQKSKKTFALS